MISPGIGAIPAVTSLLTRQGFFAPDSGGTPGHPADAGPRPPNKSIAVEGLSFQYLGGRTIPNMAITGSAVNLSSLLLEKNRANGKGPSLLVSEWMEETGEAGFAGLEIWINHLIFSSRSEWELIMEKSREADLPIAAIAAAIPVDASDKSQRFRESVLEALDYFRPDALKFTLADPRATDALGFIKEWSRDVPRDTGLLFDAGEAARAETFAEARRILDGGRYKGVLNPFLLAPKELDAVLEAAGDFAGNVAVQARKAGKAILLEDNAEEHKKVIAAVRAKGFQGTWTLVSTQGAGLPGEDIEGLFDNAERDLNFLIEAQTRVARAR